ncbi:MAG: uroporphyrinogen decarboxylase [Oligoflexales bacterium]|nr:uroporphyrinogen decarboxylase [Oligoflexales bacterium]
MAQPENKPLVNVAKGIKSDTYPIWFLRQAGRYLPEYREIRAQMSFLELCRDPKKAAEVTIQPLKRFDLDAAIIFSDILIPPAHMGQTLTFGKGHGPLLTPHIRSSNDLAHLKHPDVEKEMGYVGDAITETKAQLGPNQTMIGFAGAPFTVASYMIEGSGSKTYSEVKKLMYQEPETFSSLLDMLAEVTSEYLSMQVKAGAEVLMLFDSWAGNLSSSDYSKYVLPSLIKLVEASSKNGVPLIYYSGQGSTNLSKLADLPVQVLAIDWRVSLSEAASLVGSHKTVNAFQGNLDPIILSWGDEALVREKVREVLDEAKKAQIKGHIFNVGHGVLPTTSPDAIKWAIDEIRNYKA